MKESPATKRFPLIVTEKQARFAEPAAGERRLLEAMVQDAIACATRTACRLRDVDERQARDWIAGDGTGLMSFRWVCEALGLDPEAVRAVVRKKRNRPALRRVPVGEAQGEVLGVGYGENRYQGR